MNDITHQFYQTSHPVKAILLYKSHPKSQSGEGVFTEVMDIDERGKPVNPHPLTSTEAHRIGKLLLKDSKKEAADLQPAGLLPPHVIYLNTTSAPFAIWHTPAGERPLFFQDGLTIPSGRADVPALLWVGSRRGLRLFALADDARPTLETPLFRSPFFNTGDTGSVCMGSAPVNRTRKTTLEAFMTMWEETFFGSYFSHLSGTNPVEGNIVTLWQDQLRTGQAFPVDRLKRSTITLSQLL